MAFEVDLNAFNVPGADRYALQWFKDHALPYPHEAGDPAPPLPAHYRTYFVDNLVPPPMNAANINEAGLAALAARPILVDVEIGPLRIKGTYTIEGDNLNAEVGIQVAPEVYLRLGPLVGNPGAGPIVVNFDQNPAFYGGNLTVQFPIPLPGEVPGIFGGLIGTVNWVGLGIQVVEAVIDIIRAL